MTVVRIDKGGITVAPGDATELLVVAAKAVRRVVVGDICALDEEAGRIEEILPRRTVFERRSPGGGRDDVAVTSKALAANMDHVLVVQAMDSGLNVSRLARELTQAWQSGAQPVVVLTKSDLISADEAGALKELAERYSPGVPVICVSTRHDVELSQLSNLLPCGSVSALLGASGVGKSTLANAMAGHPVQLTAEVRQGDRRGRHTTAAGQMIPLSDGSWLIDTPGIRGVGLWACDEGLELAFADLASFAQECRFADCSHTNEPGCGLLAAVSAGQVDPARLDLWHALVAEVENLEIEMEQRERDLRHQRDQRSRARAANQRGKPRR